MSGKLNDHVRDYLAAYADDILRRPVEHVVYLGDGIYWKVSQRLMGRLRRPGFAGRSSIEGKRG